MSAAGPLLERFWLGMAAHLWQTSLFLLALAAVAASLRRAPARWQAALYGAGVLKLLLPLPLLGRMSGRFLEASDASQAASAAGGAAWRIDALLFPAALEPAPGGVSGVPPRVWLLLTAVWLLGCGVSLWQAAGRGSGRAARLRRLEQAPEEVRAPLVAAAGAARIPAGALRLAPEGTAPAVAGLLRPGIRVPERIVRALGPEELAAVLLHEREHLRRRDPLRFAVLLAARTVFWFYPPAAWLAARLRESTEMACDEAVLREGISPSIYCRSLARAVGAGLGTGRALPAAGAFGHSAPSLRRRVERIRSAGRFQVMFAHRVSVAAAAVTAVVGSFLPLAPAGPVPAAGEPVPAQRAGKDGVTYPRLIEESKTMPGYPEEAREAGLQGRVVLEAEILSTGEVARTKVLAIEPEGYEPFAESARKAIAGWRYEPATRDGEPVDVTFTIVVEFSLREKLTLIDEEEEAPPGEI